MSTSPLPVVLQPALVEEAVLRAIAGHREEHAFRRARNPLYLISAFDEREIRFQEFHLAWFDRLGLGQPIHRALAELPSLAQACVRCLVTPAPTRRDEGADLLVATEPGAACERTVAVRLRPTAFSDPDALLTLLRAELLHVADMVDPAFGYEPRLPLMDGGPSSERLLRDRYRVLWDVSVAGRLVRRGVAEADAHAQAYRAFCATFPMLGPAMHEGFERFFDGEVCTHAELVAFALMPRGRDPAQGLAPGGRCPLCRFPTYARELRPDRLSPAVIDQITADFPNWRPADGLCSQCAELYRSRPLSAAAADVLPGAEC